MSSRNVVFATILLILLLSVSLAAVEKYGRLEGKIVDDQNLPLPGVTVEVRGSALQGERTAVSNGRGSFRLLLLPVGNDYTVVLTMDGFNTVIQKNVKIELDKSTIIQFTLEQASLTEEVVVTATTPVVDLKSSTSQTNVSSEVIETLANDRQYQTIMSMVPGSIDANNPYMMGGSDSDNIYLLDGMDSTDPMTRTWSTSMNFDNFEEIQVITTGAPAEYGRGTGAVVNIVTKSGSNRLHGTARVHMTKTDWNAQAAGNRYFFSDATHYLNELRPGINLGGPVFKDKLWFFASWERRNKWKPSAVYQNFDDWKDLTPTAGKAYYQGHYLSGKMTFKPHAKHTLIAQYSEDPITMPYGGAYAGANYYSPEMDYIKKQGGWNMSGEWSAVLSDCTYTTLRYSGKRNKLSNEPRNLEGPAYYRGGVYFGASVTDYRTTRHFDQIQFSVNHFWESGFGAHDIKAGFELFDIRNSRVSNSYPSQEYIRLHYDAAATPMYRRVYLNNVEPANSYTRSYTLFLQDRWSVLPNLTLNIGLRAESNSWKNHAKQNVLKWGFGDLLAPRIGLAYNLSGHKFYANWGRYFDFYGTWLVDSSQPNEFIRTYDYYLGEYYGYPTWTKVATYSYGAASLTTVDEDGLDPQYMDEVGLGYEYALNQTIAFGVDFLSRAWKDKIEDYDVGFSGAPYFNPDLDGNWHFANAVYPGWGRTYKKYSAFMVKLKKNLGNDKFQFLASYTASWLKGFSGSDGEGTWGDNLFADHNRLGWLPNDVRHMVKFNGNYFLPLDINLGVSLFWMSGMPYTETASVYYPVNGQTYSYNLERQGSRRYPATWRLDLRVEKKFIFAKRLAFSLYADIFNLFNNQIEVDRDNGIGTIVLDGNQVGGAYSVLTPNLDYGNYTQWYPPTSFFIGAKFEF